MDVRESYDSAAEAYAEHLSEELAGKPLDRHLLNRFAEETRGRGLVADLGCGPGHVARYLDQQGVSIFGVDFSARMVAVARSLNPHLDFRVEDMRRLDASDASLAGVVLFYSIVHFDSIELPAVFREARRVLMPGGLALVSFHVGEKVAHRDDLFGARVSLDFRCHAPDKVVAALRLPISRSSNRFIASPMRDPSILSADATWSRELPDGSTQRTALRVVSSPE